MPTLASVIKVEIRRLARREVERVLQRVQRVKRQVKALRLAAQTNRQALARLERRLKRLRSVALAQRGAPLAGSGPRFSPKGVFALRSRLGMTRVQFARALKVSPGSIFGWEHGRTLPRGKNVARLLALKRNARSPAARSRRGRSRRRR